MFDPERFSESKVKNAILWLFNHLVLLANINVPGYRFSYAEIAVILSVLLRRFKIHLVGAPVVQPEYMLVTQPKEEIWITVTKR